LSCGYSALQRSTVLLPGEPHLEALHDAVRRLASVRNLNERLSARIGNADARTRTRTRTRSTPCSDANTLARAQTDAHKHARAQTARARTNGTHAGEHRRMPAHTHARARAHTHLVLIRVERLSGWVYHAHAIRRHHLKQKARRVGKGEKGAVRGGFMHGSAKLVPEGAGPREEGERPLCVCVCACVRAACVRVCV
jgi:hypothetical protein